MLDRHAVQALVQAGQSPRQIPISSGSRGAPCSGLPRSPQWSRSMMPLRMPRAASADRG